jgi:hypothetical protein
MPKQRENQLQEGRMRVAGGARGALAILLLLLLHAPVWHAAFVASAAPQEIATGAPCEGPHDPLDCLLCEHLGLSYTAASSAAPCGVAAPRPAADVPAAPRRQPSPPVHRLSARDPPRA